MFGVIWDLDGTLVDTELNHFRAWQALMRENGRDLTHEQFRPTFGLRNDDILIDHFDFDGGAAAIEALSERKEELFRASLRDDGVRAQRGAHELVSHLRALGAGQAIASSAPLPNIDLMLQMLDAHAHFDAIVSADEVVHGKPAPDIVLRAAEKLGLPPARCVVLEDAPAGVQAAKAAGSRAIAIVAAFPAASLQAAGADCIVSSFGEVLWSTEQWEGFLE